MGVDGSRLLNFNQWTRHTLPFLLAKRYTASGATRFGVVM